MESEKRGSSHFPFQFNLNLEEDAKTRIWRMIYAQKILKAFDYTSENFLDEEDDHVFRNLPDGQTAFISRLLSFMVMSEEDEDSFGHSRFVAGYTILMAKALGYEKGYFLRDMERGALLHDLGKVGIPESVLKKRSPLTFVEREMIKEHPLLGYEMIKGLDFLKRPALVVLYHHERYDGAGYPFGLSQGAIPLEARIFSLADTLDAITSDRPYRKRKGFQEALEEIRRGSGCQFDPFLVDVMLEIPKKYWEKTREDTLTRLRQLSSHRPKKIYLVH